MRIITNELIQKFKTYLIGEEKSSSTLEKYIRDITVFMEWCKKTELNKSVVLEYKQNIVEKYAPTSVNSILSSLQTSTHLVYGFENIVRGAIIHRNTILK